MKTDEGPARQLLSDELENQAETSSKDSEADQKE